MKLSIKEFGVRKQVQIWLLPCPVCVNTQVVQVSKLSAPVSWVLQWNKLRTQGRQSGNTHLGNADTTNMSTSGERALPGSTLTESPTSLSSSLLEKTALPGAFPSEQSSPTALSSYTYLTIPLKQGWCFMLGHHQRNRSSSLLFSFLHQNQQSSNLNHNEVAEKAEREILSKRIPRGSLESCIHSCWDTEASIMLKLR